jgi:hypothetical protein
VRGCDARVKTAEHGDLALFRELLSSQSKLDAVHLQERESLRGGWKSSAREGWERGAGGIGGGQGEDAERVRVYYHRDKGHRAAVKQA